MTLKKGDIVFYSHKNSFLNSNVKCGSHENVVLHNFNHPLKTYLLAPITTTPSNSNVSYTCINLEKSKYNEVLDHDSYVDLRFIVAADESRILFCKRNDHHTAIRKNGSIINPNIQLDSIDLNETRFTTNINT